MELTFVCSHPRTYLFPGHPPVEAEPGGTYDVPEDPNDGCWQAPAAKAGKSAKQAPDTSKEA